MRFKDIILRHWLLIAIFLLGLSIRIYTVSGDSVGFWYDQARDAQITTEMVENRDIKLQGPSASGTNESVYHGVAYYYIIAPLYALGNGSPLMVSYGLALIGSISILIGYWVSRNLFKSEAVGLVTAFLLAVSFFNSQASVWLSNPQFLIITVPAFYYFLWKVSTKNRTLTDFVFLGVCLGLSLQFAVYELFLGFSLVVWYGVCMWNSKKFLVFSITELACFIAATVLSVSTMILTEVLMYQRGILQLTTLSEMSGGAESITSNLFRTAEFYQYIVTGMVAPYTNWIIVLILLLPILLSIKTMSSNMKIWALLFFAGPVWLLSWQFRDSPQAFLGLESILYVLMSYGIVLLKEKFKFGTVLAILFLLSFAYFNISVIISNKHERRHFLVIQERAFLAEQLATIDKTYLLANGNEFTFSSLTGPYGINITWSYLYNWYGRSKYGYVPKFVGLSQKGLIGESLLEETDLVSDTHFTIIEPDVLVNKEIAEKFYFDQDLRAGSVSAEYAFGTLTVQAR